MIPENIAKVLAHKGPTFFLYVKQCLPHAPGGLTPGKVEAFMKNPDKDPVTDEQLAFLTDCVKGRYIRVEEYDPHTGNAVGAAMVLVASTKSAAPVLLGVRGNPADSAKVQEYMSRTYEAGRGNVLGKSTASKPVVADAFVPSSVLAARAREAKENKPGKVRQAVQQLMTFGRPAAEGAQP